MNGLMKWRLILGLVCGVFVAGVSVFILSDTDNSGKKSPFDFPTVAITPEEQRALWESLKKESTVSWGALKFLGYNDKYVLHEGDLTIKGDFDLSWGQSLIVEGNLIVEGTYNDNGSCLLYTSPSPRDRG